MHRLHPQADGGVLAVTDWGPLLLPNHTNPHGWHELAVPATAITVGATGTATIVEASRPALHGHRLILRPFPSGSPETLTVALTLTDEEAPAPGDRVHIHINPAYCQPLTPAVLPAPLDRQLGAM